MTSILITQWAIAVNPVCAWGIPSGNALLFVSLCCGTKEKVYIWFVSVTKFGVNRKGVGSRTKTNPEKETFL
jgi:hypothetical protein